MVDASVIANLLVFTDERGELARTAMRADLEWAAPEHWKAEVFSVLRGLVLGGKLTAEAGEHALRWIPRLGVDHVGLDELLPRMWQLRGGINGYDAAYVALAQARRLTLVSADRKLATAASHHCRVEYAGLLPER